MSFTQISQITMFVKREIVVGCWQCTYSYEIIKWYVNFHINLNISFWSQISFSYTLNFNVSNLCAPTLITWPKLMSKHEQTKSYKNNSLTDHIFSYRLWLAYRIFLFTHLIYSFRLCKWKKKRFYDSYSTIFYPFYTKVERYQLLTINMVYNLLKLFHFQCLVL